LICKRFLEILTPRFVNKGSPRMEPNGVILRVVEPKISKNLKIVLDVFRVKKSRILPILCPPPLL
jgi:hypothetical protein